KKPDVNREQYRVVAKPKGSGIHGLQIPIFGHLGLEGAVSLGGKAIDSSPRARCELSLLSTYAFFAARRLLESSDPNRSALLSKREKEVLSLTALGRRQADIAIALGVSPRTIENHLRNARLKLGGATTAETIRIAIQRGDINSHSI
ncbi:TPA: LuxR family transcriptional regulator, partial [Vibrio cholerae]|nr:LuxR family transcriptional regulator [Vibrio cholerae]